MIEAPPYNRKGPSEKITIGCFTYIARAMEAREFERFFFGVINASDGITKAMTEESRKSFQAEVSKYKSSVEGFSVGRQFLNEVLLARKVESFDLYLSHMLRLIFVQRPGLVLDEDKLDAADRAAFGDGED